MVDDMGHLAREIAASYEARVSSVEQIIEATHEMLEAFRGQREAMRTQLRETLARASSLRRRDFDAMMQGILARQEEREKAVKRMVKAYLREQREMAMGLRERLAKSESEGIGDFKAMVEDIRARQLERELEIKTLLADFRREEEEVTSALRGLLSNGGSMRVSDFKATLRAIQSRCWAGRAKGGRDDGDPVRLLSGGRIRPL